MNGNRINPIELELLLIPFNTACALETSAFDLCWTRTAAAKVSSGEQLDGYIRSWQDKLVNIGKPHITNADQVLAAKDRLWRKSQGGIRDLLGWFITLADDLLEGPGVPGPKATRLGFSANCLLSARIDIVLLRAAWHASRHVTGTNFSEKHFLSAPKHQPLDRLLKDAQGGLAETHLHVNAALTSELAWCCTIGDAETSLPKPQHFCATTFTEGGFPRNGSGRQNQKGLVPWLWWARITRVLLCDFAREAKAKTSFVGWCQARLLRAMDSCFETALAQQIAKAWRAALAGDSDAWFVVGDSSFPDLIKRLCSNRTWAESNNDESVLRRVLADERGFLLDAFYYAWRRRHKVSSNSKPQQNAPKPCAPSEWDRAFLQYLRIRNLYHRHLTLNEPDSGFIYFYDVFRRGSPVAKRLLRDDRAGLAVAFEHLDPLHQISRVEFRHPTRIEDPSGLPKQEECLYRLETLEERLRGLETFELAAEEEGARQGGLIFHFNKKTKVGVDGVQLKASNNNLVNGKWRLGHEFTALLEESQCLTSLWNVSPLHHWIIGFDVAEVETLLPNWPFLAVLRHLRREVERSSARRPAEPTPGFTFHAGECFYLVLAGLHRIGQVVEFLGENSVGGRIGHGLALDARQTSLGRRNGESNEAWAMALCWARQIFTMNNEWLNGNLNLAVRRIRQAASFERSAAAPKWMREVIRQFDGELLVQAYQQFGIPEALARMGFPFGSPLTHEPDCESERLAAALLYSSGYNQWAQQTNEMLPDAPDELLSELRHALRDQVAQLRKDGIPITIEGCPSSNLAIGTRSGNPEDQTAGYSSHPAINLYCRTNDPPPWRVSINTDNPLTFGVDLREEYWRMYRSFTNEGGDQWVLARRRDAFDFSFLPQIEKRPSYSDLWRALRIAGTDCDIQAGLSGGSLSDWWQRST